MTKKLSVNKIMSLNAYVCDHNGLFGTSATECIRSVRFVCDHNLDRLARWLPSAFAHFFFFCDHSGSFDTLATEHIRSVHVFAGVCHRSKQIGSARDSVCRSCYVAPFRPEFLGEASLMLAKCEFQVDCKSSEPLKTIY